MSLSREIGYNNIFEMIEVINVNNNIIVYELVYANYKVWTSNNA